jgi:DNA-binding NarL/FixJ family response regulator
MIQPSLITDKKRTGTAELLLVDNSVILRERLKHMLADEPGISVIGEAGAGYDALGLLARRRYSLVLLDISLPDLTGFQLLTQIKEKYPALPVLMLTTYNEPQFVAKAHRLGAVGYVAKEKIHKDLVAAIQAAVG